MGLFDFVGDAVSALGDVGSTALSIGSSVASNPLFAAGMNVVIPGSGVVVGAIGQGLNVANGMVNGGGSNNQKPSANISGNYPAFFQHANFGGWAKEVAADCSWVGDVGIPNDDMTSLYLPQGWSVTIFQDKDFKGSSQTFYQTTANVGGAWNDKMSSFKVTPPQTAMSGVTNAASTIITGNPHPPGLPDIGTQSSSNAATQLVSGDIKQTKVAVQNSGISTPVLLGGFATLLGFIFFMTKKR